MEICSLCIYVYIYAYRYEGTRFRDIVNLNYAIKYAIFGDLTAWDRSHSKHGRLEFAIFFPIEFGLTLEKKMRIA